jgi:malate dehydrogenase
VAPGLISSFPVRSDGSKLEVAKWVDVPEYSRWKIDQSLAELEEERELVKELLG